ncbi:MAG: EAL domain-containing protein [Ruminococcaceae bacterium]|nr:EAL domain-containing protein [Oscillospiraceae bacterium]
MEIVSSCFAISIVFVISLSFFQTKYFLTKSSRYFAASLFLTLATALVSLCYALLAQNASPPPHVFEILAMVKYLLPPTTAAFISLYLIHKVIDHVFVEKHLFFPMIAIISSLIALAAVTLTNYHTGILFEVTDAGEIIKGPAFLLDYVAVAVDIVVCLAFCIRHGKSLSKNLILAIRHSGLIIAFCIVVSTQIVGVNCLVVTCALIEAIFFLNFQNQRLGVHSLTKLNDRRRYFLEVDNRIKHKKKFKTYIVRAENINVLSLAYGYKAGDEIVCRFAFLLERMFHYGAVFHLDAYAFAIMLPYHEKDSEEQNEKLREMLKKPIDYNGTGILLKTTVVEYVCHSTGSTDADYFYEKLDYALEQASEQNKPYSVYTPELGHEMLRRKYIISRLKQVDRESGFEIYFQPVYSVRTKRFSSMETLLRLHEPDGTSISPGEFIPIAERTGLIVPITWFVINEVCRAFSENRAFDDMLVSINLPTQMLISDGFRQKLNDVVDSYGISHHRIAFEFTERVVFDDLRIAEYNMSKLTEDGYVFYLDDFGVGYSNFNCIMRLPIQTVKLDMSITATADTMMGDCNLVKILADFFHDMNLGVTAEGVESEEQAEVLESYGIDYIQGYYFAKPMPVKQTASFLKRKSNVDFSTNVFKQK